MVRTKILRGGGGKRAGKATRVLPQRSATTGRFLSGKPIKVLSNERGRILGSGKRGK